VLVWDCSLSSVETIDREEKSYDDEKAKRQADGNTMKTIIYYFTGTGNSLAAAKRIESGIGDCDLVPIASLQDTTGDVLPWADRVGIVCPVYFSGLPVMVAEFAGRLDLSGSEYTFSVVTFGGSGASSALRQLDDILKEKHGRGLDAGFMEKCRGTIF
jgi:flavodoxin